MIQQTLFQSLLWEAIMSSSRMNRVISSLTGLSIQHFLCQPRYHPPSKVALKDGFGEAVMAVDIPQLSKELGLMVIYLLWAWGAKQFLCLRPSPANVSLAATTKHRQHLQICGSALECGVQKVTDSTSFLCGLLRTISTSTKTLCEAPSPSVLEDGKAGS